MANRAKPIPQYFRHLHSKPCWQAVAEFGTYLSLYFGAPKVKVLEAKPGARSMHNKRRRAFVDGEFLLWVEMADWEYSAQRKSRIRPTSRARIRQVAVELRGQVLVHITVKPRLRETTFRFDQGGALRVWPGVDLRDDDVLWHFFLTEQGHAISFRADGQFEYGPSSRKASTLVRSTAVVYAV